MFPSNALNGGPPLGSTGGNFGGRQSIQQGSNIDFTSPPSNSYFNRSRGSASNALSSLRDLTGQLNSGVSNPKDALLALSSPSGVSTASAAMPISINSQQFINGPADRNGSLASCRGQSVMGAAAVELSDSDFPSLNRLGNHFSTINYQGAQHSYPRDVLSALQRAPYANLMKSAESVSINPNAAEFNIQSEDFPALPGANSTGGQLDANTHANTNQPALSGPQLGSGLSDSLSPTDSRFLQERSIGPQQLAKSGIQTLPDGRVTGIPAGMLNDQFGMAGLLTFLRAIENDPNIVALALGHDLTTLGLNLNAPEKNLFITFGGPWSDQPCRTHDADCDVPEEYMTNISIREKLPSIKLNKLTEDVLFYLFYNYPSEVYQMAAACELYSRDWRFHKGETVWLTRSQYGGVKEQTGAYETGTYNIFDPSQWRKIPKEMTLEYKQLEERPILPPQLKLNQQSSASGDRRMWDRE